MKKFNYYNLNKRGNKMQETDNIVTIFRKRRDIDSDKLYESLLTYGVDPDTIQRIYQNESPDLFTFFRVDKLPTVLCFANGEETKHLIGKEIDINTLINFLK